MTLSVLSNPDLLAVMQISDVEKIKDFLLAKAAEIMVERDNHPMSDVSTHLELAMSGIRYAVGYGFHDRFNSSDLLQPWNLAFDQLTVDN
jgi:hypothetical protein